MGLGTTYKQDNDIQMYTRMKVGPSKGDNVYPVESFYYYFDVHSLRSVITDVQVYANTDGTVSLKCVENGLYATWGNKVLDTGENYGLCHGCPLPICMESEICPNCRFSLVDGSW